MPKYKAIVSDIDGTLVQFVPDALPSDVVRTAVKKTVENGYTFCLASGKPFSLVKIQTSYLGITGPCIVDNGAVIADSETGEILWEAILSTSHANKILEKVRHCPLFRASCESGIIKNPTELPTNSKVRKISVHDISPELADTLMHDVTNEFSDVSVIKAGSFAGGDLVDVYFSHTNATKQQAVFKLAELLNISTEEIIGIGDGYNDFPLLMACGLKVAMGNAVEELKAIADEIAPSADDDGLAFILEKYFGQREALSLSKN